jgi:hypothetical protein
VSTTGGAHRFISRPAHGRIKFRSTLSFGLWAVTVNRAELQRLAEDRVLDAKALLDANRWAGAYYMVGYAMECGLKSCVLAFVERTGEIFKDKKFSEKCFTHKLLDLIEISGLKDVHLDLLKNNAGFAGFWGVAKEWTEAARYQQRTEVEAKDLYEAITNDPNGVLPWIRTNW